MPVETVTVELKSGPIEVEQFTDIPSAIEFFTRADENGYVIVNREASVLQLINHRHQMNQAKKARNSRSPLALKRLGYLIKENPEFRARVNDLLSEFDKPQLEGVGRSDACVPGMLDSVLGTEPTYGRQSARGSLRNGNNPVLRFLVP